MIKKPRFLRKSKKSKSNLEPLYQDRAWLRDDAVLYIEGFDEPVYLYKLRRIIGNSAANLDIFTKWLDTIPAIEDHSGNVSRGAALSYFCKTRDSLTALALLMKAEEAYSPIQQTAKELRMKREYANDG